MEELLELKERLSRERPASWENLPDIALYMDQVISYLPRQLIHYGEGENLTSAMVNNYIKDGLLPRADGKKYDQTHLAYLTAICALKQVLSVKEMKALIQDGLRDREPERVYNYFCRALDSSLMEAADTLDEGTQQENLSRLALELALRSYANRLACQRILSLLQEKETPSEEKKSGKAKEKSKEKVNDRGDV